MLFKRKRTRRALLFASAPDSLSLKIMQAVAARFPEHVVDYAVTPPLLEQLAISDQARTVFVAGEGEGRLRFVVDARYLYDMVIFIASGDKGFGSMKLGAFLAGFGMRMICYNENSDAFEVRFSRWPIICRHLYARLRMGHHKRWGTAVATLIVRGLYSALSPIGLLWMLLTVGWFSTRAALGRPRDSTCTAPLLEQQGS